MYTNMIKNKKDTNLIGAKIYFIFLLIIIL